MSALFNFQSLLLVILLMICTCTYVRAVAPRLIDKNKNGIFGLFFMSARIGTSPPLFEASTNATPTPVPTPEFDTKTGERLSPYVALACMAMAVTILLQ